MSDSEWVKVDAVPDMLGMLVSPGVTIAYPADRYTRVARVIECFEQRRNSHLVVHRVRILGVSSNYKNDPATWKTYIAFVENLTQVVQVHPELFNAKLRWLRDRANEEGLP